MNPSVADPKPTRPSPLPRTGILAPDGKPFTWGPIQAIHGPIDGIEVVEYLQDKSNHSASQPEEWLRHGQTQFHPYIDGRDAHTSYRRLDSAVVGAIGMRRSGPDSQAARHFDLMTLGVIPSKE